MNTLPGFIDQSQERTWHECHGKWYERYVARMGAPRDPTKLRDDAAAIGTLVHGGLEVYENTGDIVVPEWAIEEVRPTPEALAQARELLTAYALHGPPKLWPLRWFEEPLRKQVQVDALPYDILAKVDFHFYVPEPIEIRIGAGQYEGTTVLQRGFYAQEYKTKGASRDRGAWLAEWAMKPQAGYQLLTLQEFATTQTQVPEAHRVARGVLVTVLEYDRPYVPKRTCKNCREMLPFASYTPTEAGMYRCINCGGDSKFQPVKDKEPTPPSIWRHLVTRTTEQLAGIEHNICNIVREMHAMVEAGGVGSWNGGACVGHWGGACEYLPAHQYWRAASEMDGFVSIDALSYMTQGKEVGV